MTGIRAYIEAVDAQHDAYIHAVDKSELDIIAEHCKALQSAGLTKTHDGDWHAMTVHGWTIQAWCDKRGVTFRQFMRDKSLQDRFIHDPDNAAFRVHGGRI